MNSLAIIPARGGSKRFPKKNIKILNGKPLIVWTIEAALQSGYFDTVMVSTDCNEIAKVSRDAGAEVPFMRSAELSQDDSTSVDVALHSLEYYGRKGDEFGAFMLLQPTSPLRTAQHIVDAFSLLKAKNADAVISVCKCEHSPLWSNTLDESWDMSQFIRPDLRGLRSQDLPDYYRLNGAIYLIKTGEFLNAKAFLLSSNVVAYNMLSTASIDIDDELDFIISQELMKKGVRNV